MYLLIGIWGSTGEVRPRGVFAWAFRETGVGTKEYAAMKLTLYLLFGSAFILVGILALYVNAGATSFSFLDFEASAFPRGLQRWVFLAFYVIFIAAYSFVPTPVSRNAQANTPRGRTSPVDPQMPISRYIGST